MMKSKVISVGMAAAFALAGCGGGGSSSSETGSNSSQADANTSIPKAAKSISALTCRNTSDLMAGRPVMLEDILNNSEGRSDTTVSYYLMTADMLDDNGSDSQERGKNFGNAIVSLPPGTITHDLNLTLPPDLSTGEYKILAMLHPDTIEQKDYNYTTAEEEPLYKQLYAVTDTLYIEANDGKPDVVTTYLSVEDNSQAKQISKQAPAKQAVSYHIPFDIGIIGEDVIVNDKNISFTGIFGAKTYITDAMNVQATACIAYGSACDPVKIFHVDENNATVFSNTFTIDKITFDHEEDILFNAFIDSELLKKIATKVLKDKSLVTKLRVTLGGIDESSSQNPNKNTIETQVVFTPIVLGLEHIDNTNDIIAPALSNYRFTLNNYLDDIQKIDPTYPVKSSDSDSVDLDLFQTDLTLVDTPSVDDITLSDPTKIISFGNIPGFNIKPVQTTPDFELVKPVIIPRFPDFGDNDKDVFQVTPKADIVSQLSLKNGVDSSLIDGPAVDLSTEVVHEKVFGKNIKLNTGGKYFGMTFNAGAQAVFNAEGAELTGESSVNVSMLSIDVDVFKATAYAGIKPGQLHRTGYDTEVEFLGLNIYTRSDFIGEHYHLTNSTAQDLRKRIKENIDAVEAYQQNGTDTLIDYKRYWEVYKEKKVTDTITIFLVPITFTASASGTIGVDFKMHEKSIGSVAAYADPHAHIQGSGSAAIGIPGAQVGVEGQVGLIDTNYPSVFAAGIKFESDSHYVYSFLGELSEKIIDISRPPYGEISAFAEYPWPDICYTRKCCCKKCTKIPYPCLVTKHENKVVDSFESHMKFKTLLNKHQTLFKVNIQ